MAFSSLADSANCSSSVTVRRFNFFCERFAVVFNIFRANVTSRRQHMAVAADFIEHDAFAEAGVSSYLPRAFVAAPCVVCPGNFCDVVVGQFAMDAINQRAEFAGINEKHFAAPVFEAVVPLVAGNEPEANRNLRGVKKLSRQRHHAIHQVGLNEGLADFAFAGLIRGHRAVGENESGHAGGRQGGG